MGRFIKLKQLTTCLVWGCAMLQSAEGVCVAQPAPEVVESFDGARAGLPKGWNVLQGAWRLKGNALVVDSMGGEGYLTFGSPSWQNYELTATVAFHKVKNASRWVSLLIRATPEGEVPWSQVPLRFQSTGPSGMEFAVRTDEGWDVRHRNAAQADCALDAKRTLRVVVRGATVQGWLDGELVITSNWCVDRSRGCVGLGASGCVASFDDVVLRRLPDSPDFGPGRQQTPECVAHRGFSSIAPENTLSAIRKAIESGADGCEFDVYRCGDGTIVLMHDRTVDRTTNGTGLVTELTLNQLRELDAGQWKASRYRGEGVPTLDQALRMLKGSGCRAVVEIKMPGIASEVVESIKGLEMSDEVAIISFISDEIEAAKAVGPEIVCGFLYGKAIEGTAAEQAAWLDSRLGACKADVVDLNYKHLTPMLVAELKQRGIPVWAYTANQPFVVRALNDWGIDSITTDHPDMVVELLSGDRADQKEGDSD